MCVPLLPHGWRILSPRSYLGGRGRIPYPLQTRQLRLVQETHGHKNMYEHMHVCMYECLYKSRTCLASSIHLERSSNNSLSFSERELSSGSADCQTHTYIHTYIHINDHMQTYIISVICIHNTTDMIYSFICTYIRTSPASSPAISKAKRRKNAGGRILQPWSGSGTHITARHHGSYSYIHIRFRDHTYMQIK